MIFFRFTVRKVNDSVGLGHGISNCPKLEDSSRRQVASHRGDAIGGY